MDITKQLFQCYCSVVYNSTGGLVQLNLILAKINSKMTYITNWEEFAKAAERLYVADPSKVRTLMFKMSATNVLTIFKLTNFPIFP